MRSASGWRSAGRGSPCRGSRRAPTGAAMAAPIFLLPDSAQLYRIPNADRPFLDGDEIHAEAHAERALAVGRQRGEGLRTANFTRGLVGRRDLAAPARFHRPQ